MGWYWPMEMRKNTEIVPPNWHTKLCLVVRSPAACGILWVHIRRCRVHVLTHECVDVIKCVSLEIYLVSRRREEKNSIRTLIEEYLNNVGQRREEKDTPWSLLLTGWGAHCTRAMSCVITVIIEPFSKMRLFSLSKKLTIAGHDLTNLFYLFLISFGRTIIPVFYCCLVVLSGGTRRDEDGIKILSVANYESQPIN